MNTKKKIVSAALAASIAAIAVVGSSLAYFTDKDEALNTFTVGNVDIALTEEGWNAEADHTLMPGRTYDKKPVVTVQEKSQDAWTFMEVKATKFNSWLNLNAARYEVIDNVPAGTYLKDSKMTDAFKAKIADPTFLYELFNEWFPGSTTEWQIMNMNEVVKTVEDSWDDAAVKELRIVFGYDKVLAATEAAPALFNQVTMPADVTADMITASNFNTEKADWKLDITAYGIQAAELDTLTDAYNSLF
jgi:predicted ribosomally synthesized peptide with SipW-like signal peptide